jgi:hypothetical protein
MTLMRQRFGNWKVRAVTFPAILAASGAALTFLPPHVWKL